MCSDEHASALYNATVERRVTYIGLTGILLSLMGATSWLVQKKSRDERFTWVDLVVLALASFRLGRLIAYDQVFETERSYFTDTIPHDSGAGETVVPRGTGARRAVGELVSCPICAGTWASAMLVAGLAVAPGPTQVLIKVMSAMGLAEFLNAATESLQWSGEEARKRTGLMH